MYYNNSSNKDYVSGAVVIPSTIRYDGTTFTVKSISYHAFGGCSSLTSMTIPNSVTSIGEVTFRYCSGLKEIYSLPGVPPTITNDTFDYLHYNNATLHVPAGKVKDYEVAAGWCRFSDIKHHSFSGIEDNTADGDANEAEVVGYYSTYGVRADEP